LDVAIALAVLALLVLANGLATRTVLRNPYAERRQKLFQLLALWLLPIFGAIFIFALHRKPEKPSGGYRQSLDPPWEQDRKGSRKP
jgi:hypothetical protein